jgi:hypothetical protein
MIDIYHQPKQLEIQVIELKLEIDSEKERNSKPKHKTQIIMVRAANSRAYRVGEGLLT